jgi:hypothetical protein
MSQHAGLRKFSVCGGNLCVAVTHFLISEMCGFQNQRFDMNENVWKKKRRKQRKLKVFSYKMLELVER